MSITRPGATRFARRDNDRLAYEISGEGSEPVVLLHPLLADRGALAPLRDALRPAYQVVLPDARGHGASAAFADRRATIADTVADVLAILDAEGIATAHVVGQGLGGTTAFELARVHAERVRSLTLIEPALAAILDSEARPAAHAARAEARERERRAADAAYKGLTDQALATLLDARLGLGWQQRLPRPRLAAIRRHAGALAGALTALDAYAVPRDAVQRMTLPTLLVLDPGADTLDRCIAERLAASLPDARIETVPIPAPFVPDAGAAAPLNGAICRFFRAAAG